MARKRKNIIVAVVADLHINSTLGLMPKVFVRDDGESVWASHLQNEVFRAWLSYWADVKKQVRAHKATLYVVINGDVCEGFHHGTTQLITHNPADQFKLAIDVLEPVARMADRLFIVRGTSSHAGTAAHWEEVIADDLGAVPDEVTGTASWWHLPMDVNGVLMHFSHHRRQNTLPWTSGGAANRLAAETVYEYARSGDRLPDVVVRSHGHIFDESSRIHPVKVIFSPAWQLKTEFSHRIAPDRMPAIGGLIFRCRGGQFEWEPKVYPFKRREPWS